jgi:N-acetylglucosamine kinase-like BadF-type ATPase
MFAPFVFEAARQGDTVARRVLEETGRELGLAARVAAAKVGFGPDDPLPLVLGGSVLRRAADPVFADAIVGDVRSAFPRVMPAILEYPPVLGALLLAIDASGVPVRPAVRDALGRALDATGEL